MWFWHAAEFCKYILFIDEPNSIPKTIEYIKTPWEVVVNRSIGNWSQILDILQKYYSILQQKIILGCLSCQNGFNILLAIFPLERTVCTGYFLFCVQIFTFTTCKGERWTYCPKPNTTRTQVQKYWRQNLSIQNTCHLSTKSTKSSENFPFGNVGGGWKKPTAQYIALALNSHLSRINDYSGIYMYYSLYLFITQMNNYPNIL